MFGRSRTVRGWRLGWPARRGKVRPCLAGYRRVATWRLAWVRQTQLRPGPMRLVAGRPVAGGRHGRQPRRRVRSGQATRSPPRAPDPRVVGSGPVLGTPVVPRQGPSVGRRGRCPNCRQAAPAGGGAGVAGSCSSSSAARTCSSITGATTLAIVVTMPVVAAAAAATATPSTLAAVAAAAFMAITRPTVRPW